MVKQTKLVICAALLLAGAAGCAQRADPEINETMLSSAVAVAGIIAEANISSMNVEGVSNCIISNATPREVVNIAIAANGGIDQSTVEKVLEISIRPKTINCIEGLGLIRL